MASGGVAMRVVVQAAPERLPGWLRVLRAAGPEFTFEPWDRLAEPRGVEAAVVWNPPPDLFTPLVDLRCIGVLGAGIDGLLAAVPEPPEVPVVRIVDPVMAERMAGWVLGAVLHWHRGFHDFLRLQRERRWEQRGCPDTADVRVGVMGLGAMGRAAAALLAQVGYEVAGWSRSPRSLAGIRTFAGAAERDAFLARSDYLVCLLPLTAETRGILNAATFRTLPRGAVVINAGRGGHLVEADLLDALAAHHLRGAVLDVFAEEPLPPEHPFWAHPAVVISPHVASITNQETGAVQIVEALRAVRDGRRPANVVDLGRGY